jgi:hypothetical protein
MGWMKEIPVKPDQPAPTGVDYDMCWDRLRNVHLTQTVFILISAGTGIMPRPYD